jgi:hypothetical protein
VSQFIWANHSELINLEKVSTIRLLIDDNLAHAFFPGNDKPIMVTGPAALSLVKSLAEGRPPKPANE